MDPTVGHIAGHSDHRHEARQLSIDSVSTVDGAQGIDGADDLDLDSLGRSDLTEDFDAFYDQVSQEWQEQALCAQTDPEAFFPEKGGSTREAKRICRACVVRDQCLEYALENDERFGIWGGLSERERRRVKKKLS